MSAEYPKKNIAGELNQNTTQINVNSQNNAEDTGTEHYRPLSVEDGEFELLLENKEDTMITDSDHTQEIAMDIYLDDGSENPIEPTKTKTKGDRNIDDYEDPREPQTECADQDRERKKNLKNRTVGTHNDYATVGYNGEATTEDEMKKAAEEKELKESMADQ
jgi:hypothetical protein